VGLAGIAVLNVEYLMPWCMEHIGPGGVWAVWLVTMPVGIAIGFMVFCLTWLKLTGQKVEAPPDPFANPFQLPEGSLAPPADPEPGLLLNSGDDEDDRPRATPSRKRSFKKRRK
jgi:hypothetical protein